MSFLSNKNKAIIWWRDWMKGFAKSIHLIHRKWKQINLKFAVLSFFDGLSWSFFLFLFQSKSEDKKAVKFCVLKFIDWNFFRIILIVKCFVFFLFCYAIDLLILSNKSSPKKQISKWSSMSPINLVDEISCLRRKLETRVI